MRRLFITIVTLFVLISSFAFQSALADVDLSGMSFDELPALMKLADALAVDLMSLVQK